MNKFVKFMQEYGVLVALIALIVIAAIWKTDTFLSAVNLRNIVNQSAAVGIIAVGMTVVIMTRGIDLSVGSAVALSAVIGLKFMNGQLANGGSEGPVIALAMLIVVVVGVAVGAFNALLVTVGRVAPFIATLGGLVAFRSLTKVVAGGGQVKADSLVFEELASKGIAIPGAQLPNGEPVMVTWGIMLFVAVALAYGVLLSKTAFGRHVVAVGANERAARYSGINAKSVRAIAYTLLGLCVGLAAVVQAVRYSAIAPQQTGVFYELDAIAAVVIGGTSLAGGKGRIWGTVVGVMILAVISNLLVLMNVSSDWQDFVKGAIILIAVLMQRGQGDRN
ncbi:MAG: ABC transporter permease [Armatimonadetes bacterium]|nr:ABC transporter permease [Armatimonadota bacterium]